MNAVKLRSLGPLLLVVLCVVGCGRQGAGPVTASTNSTVTTATPELVPMTNMVLIRGGAFTRGRHSVTISRDFWLGKYEVTQAEYAALMTNNPSHFKDRPEAPVEKVRYLDATAYCSALTRIERQAGRLPPGYEYRLPTEAEWEYACRAGTTNRFSFGETPDDADQYAWTWENSEGSTHPVGQKRPNPWGLHDIHGNVWEWCLDWFGDYPEMDTIDPIGPAQGKFGIFRGGGWNNEVQFARSANRFMMEPVRGIHFVGFRVALAMTIAGQSTAPSK
ncbi:MAG: formylglycine-generating enzyme family protein [Limisphaerales bacterium]